MEVNHIKALLILIMFSTLLSCDVTKRALTAKAETQQTTQTDEKRDITREGTTVKETTREGGEITTDILPLEERPRDENGNFEELIQTIKDGGLTKTIYYRPDGTASVNCDAADILERIESSMIERDNSLIKRMDQIEQKSKVKEQEKKKEFKTSSILYMFGGLTIFVVGALGFFYVLMKKQLAALTTL